MLVGLKVTPEVTHWRVAEVGARLVRNEDFPGSRCSHSLAIALICSYVSPAAFRPSGATRRSFSCSQPVDFRSWCA